MSAKKQGKNQSTRTNKSNQSYSGFDGFRWAEPSPEEFYHVGPGPLHLSPELSERPSLAGGVTTGEQVHKEHRRGVQSVKRIDGSLRKKHKHNGSDRQAS